jgi:hypothetical protein
VSASDEGLTSPPECEVCGSIIGWGGHTEDCGNLARQQLARLRAQVPEYMAKGVEAFLASNPGQEAHNGCWAAIKADGKEFAEELRDGSWEEAQRLHSLTDLNIVPGFPLIDFGGLDD